MPFIQFGGSFKDCAVMRAFALGCAEKKYKDDFQVEQLNRAIRRLFDCQVCLPKLCTFTNGYPLEAVLHEHEIMYDYVRLCKSLGNIPL